MTPKPPTPSPLTPEEAARMISQIDAGNIPLLDWNKRVRRICEAYIRSTPSPRVTREALAKWFEENLKVGGAYPQKMADALSRAFPGLVEDTTP